MITNVAAYLDELGSGYNSAIMRLSALELSYVCVRLSHNGPESMIDARVFTDLAKRLRDKNLKTVMVASPCGNVPVTKLCWPDIFVDRSLAIAALLKAQYVRFFVGNSEPADLRTMTTVDCWMGWIADRCQVYNVTPLLEIYPSSYVFEADDVVKLLNSHPTWRLLYDPAMLVLGRKLDPFERYWIPLRSKIAAFDVHDIKIGHGPCLVGDGDCYWAETIKDVKSHSFKGWAFLEPGFANNFGSVKYECTRATLVAFNKLYGEENSHAAYST